MAKIRWRLLMGLASLGATLALTLPANGPALEAAAGKALSAGSTAVAEVIWPNGAELVEIIWPNAGVIGGVLGGDPGNQDDQGNQDNQGNQD
jgi:hypothetical protein